MFKRGEKYLFLITACLETISYGFELYDHVSALV